MSPLCDRLTSREEAVLRLWRLPDKAIAERLGISRKTVSAHMGSAFAKLDVHDRREAAVVAGLVVEAVA